MQLSGRNRALFVGLLICVILYTYLHFQFPSLSFRPLLSPEQETPETEAEEAADQDSSSSSSLPEQEAQPPPPPFEPLSRDAFVTAATRHALDAYDAAPIARFCAHDRWDSNSKMAVNCDRIFGGIGNLRQVILACLHHALEEGRGFIIPPIELRQADDLIQLESNGETAFEYMFDRDVFVSRLSAACPRMPIYPSLQAAQDEGREIYHFPTTMARFVVCQDPADFAINLGNLLVFPPVVYRLAYTALHALTTPPYSLPISPSPNFSSSSSSSSSSTPPPPTYLAIHLRTAVDAIAMGWSTYETQSAEYLSLAHALAHPVIYVASGNTSSAALFASAAAALSPPRAAVTKDDLLQLASSAAAAAEDLVQELQGLTWDQAALVDYVVLERAGFFAGVTESSFSWNVAAKRLAMAGGAEGFCGSGSGSGSSSRSRSSSSSSSRVRGRGKEAAVPPGMVWKDEWSLVYGTDDTAFGGKIWP